MEQNLNNLRSRLRQCSKAGVLCVLALFLLVEGRTEEPPEGKYLATADVEEDQGGSVIQNQPTLRELLSSPPWIKKIVFKRSGNYFPIVKPMNPPNATEHIIVTTPGYPTFEGALQMSGFYLRHFSGCAHYYRDLTPEGKVIFDNPEKGLELIFGESKEQYWSLASGHDRISFCYKDPKLGGSPKNGRQAIAGWKLKVLNEIRQFGLEHAGRCDLTWIGREQFRGRSEKLGAISGKIVLRDDQERPVELHYWPDDNSDGVVRVNYSYRSNGSIPHVFTIRGADEYINNDFINSLNPNRKTPKKILTNIIEYIELGFDESHPQGYKPSDFRKITGPLKSLAVSSNGLVYLIQQNGDWAKLDQDPPNWDKLREASDTSPYRWTLVVVGFFCLSAVVIIRMRWRKKTVSRSNKP